MRRLTSVAVAGVLLVGILTLRPSVQQGSPAASSAAKNIVRISKYIISVSNAERSAAFYQGVFGIPLANNGTQLPKAQPIPDLVQKLTSVKAR